MQDGVEPCSEIQTNNVGKTQSLQGKWVWNRHIVFESLKLYVFFFLSHSSFPFSRIVSVAAATFHHLHLNTILSLFSRIQIGLKGF